MTIFQDKPPIFPSCHFLRQKKYLKESQQQGDNKLYSLCACIHFFVFFTKNRVLCYRSGDDDGGSDAEKKSFDGW